MARRVKIIPALMGIIPWVRRSLTTQLLVLTVFVVLITEILIMIPSVANQHYVWLNMRGEAANLVGFALKDSADDRIDTMMINKVFASANILGATIVSDDVRILKLAPSVEDAADRIKRTINLDGYGQRARIADAWSIIVGLNDDLIRVSKQSSVKGGPIDDIIVSEKALRSALRTYAKNILLLSLLISAITAIFVYWSLSSLIISPVRAIRSNMALFEVDPENPKNILQASDRLDEIGETERDLTALEERLQTLLNERRRLAALGAGISKISHDLRNILASAQLMSDRLMNSDDPRVRKLSPRLVDALDRAITLSRETLNYGRISPETLSREPVKLLSLVESVFDDTASLYVTTSASIDKHLEVSIDRTQMHRALMNLIRNATEALCADLPPDTPPQAAHDTGFKIDVTATVVGRALHLDIADNGPGLPEGARDHLYEPFKGSFKPGGSGLGLAIAAEIVRAHGGNLTLKKSDEDGATFGIVLPMTQ
ncbi:MAG: HAMP domain-containing sensor histidine kinase [Pseudomonadota bacterium]